MYLTLITESDGKVRHDPKPFKTEGEAVAFTFEQIATSPSFTHVYVFKYEEMELITSWLYKTGIPGSIRVDYKTP